MRPWIIDPQDAAGSPDAGGKARALAHARHAGLPVPDWFVLSAGAFEHSLTPAQREVLNHTSDPVLLERAFNDLRVAPCAARALEHAVRDLCQNGELVAVRSSAIDEDGIRHSFAGQLDSFLNVAPTAVAGRVVDVWRSGFTPRILAYRREHGLGPAPQAPAVLVQRMVQPRAAGVAFSADPVSGRRGVAVVSAVRGLGSSIVSGEADADTWLVDRHGEIVQRQIVPDRRMQGTERVAPAADVEPSVTATATLTDDDVQAVANLARAAARHFGRPQDIEWAIGDRLVLLQSRPITSIGAISDPDGRVVIWDNSNIVESYSGVTSPLTFSFAREIYQHVYQQFCRMMGVPKRTIAGHDETFRNMLGLIRGRLYYNLVNWHRMLALLPGYGLNRSFMDQMMGVSGTLPAAVAEDVTRGAKRGRGVESLYLARTVGGLLMNHLTIDRQVAAFYTRLDDALRPPVPPLEDRRPDELVAHYRELRGRLLLSWDAPLVNDFFAMIFYGLLRRLVIRWCNDPAGTLQNDLIGGEGGMVSAEPAVRMRRLANLAARDPVLIDVLSNGTIDRILTALDAQPGFAAEYAAYLAKFGDRTINELKLESATLHDDPLPLFRAVAALAHLTATAPRTSPQAETSPADRLRIEARRRVATALRFHPFRRLAFHWVLRHAGRRVRDRENLRLERTRLFGRVRRIFLELGRHLHALHLLDDPRDVFYLETDEVLAFVEGRATCTDLRGLAQLRKREFQRYEEGAAPDDRFDTRGIAYHGHEFRRAQAPSVETGEERRGLGCSPGVVRGPVRIVRDPRTANLGSRAVLVAEHTDPGWIMVFPSALAVIVERGSLLSHAAIVARELGIPAVVSVPGVTRWLRDGDWVELDGTTGVIRRMPADA